MQVGQSPRLLLDLPLAALRLVMARLPLPDKAKLPHICKAALQTMILRKRQLTYRVRKDGGNLRAARLLCAQLATRTEALHLTLDLTAASFEVAHELVALLLQAAEAAGFGCVTDLDIQLPDLVSQNTGCAWQHVQSLLCSNIIALPMHEPIRCFAVMASLTCDSTHCAGPIIDVVSTRRTLTWPATHVVAARRLGTGGRSVQRSSG